MMARPCLDLWSPASRLIIHSVAGRRVPFRRLKIQNTFNIFFLCIITGQHTILKNCLIRGLTEENTQLGIISPIGYFKYPIGYLKSPIGDILNNRGLVNCSLTLHYSTHISPIPNWIYYPKLGIICPIGDIVC